jgi:hypothetical protein
MIRILFLLLCTSVFSQHIERQNSAINYKDSIYILDQLGRSVLKSGLLILKKEFGSLKTIKRKPILLN